ncbi:MAG: hypothetical protein ACRDTB_33490, partial [Actinophytocola sp.]
GPPAVPGGASSTSGVGGGAPPFIPPVGAGLGGTGAGGGRGGGPGSGAVRRPGGRGRPAGPPPGLPAALSGKAGRKDPHGFTPRVRQPAVESDVPSTVQLIDEDLWQVAEKTPDPVVAADPPPTRTPHPRR